VISCFLNNTVASHRYMTLSHVDCPWLDNFPVPDSINFDKARHNHPQITTKIIQYIQKDD